MINLTGFILGFILKLTGDQMSVDDTLYAFYDFAVCPITFDIVNFVCMADAERRRLKLKKFKVVFLPGFYEGFRSKTYQTTEHKEYRLRNLVLPVTRVHPACDGYVLCKTRQQANIILRKADGYVFPRGYSTVDPVGYYNWGATWEMIEEELYLPTIRSSKASRATVIDWLTNVAHGKKPIVITLRESEYQKERNSNLIAWGRFANSLDKDKYVPIFVRDHEKSLTSVPKEIEGNVICCAAPWNIEFRTSLYELSYVNMVVNNGPWLLSILNDAVNSAVVKAVTEEHYVSSSQWMIEMGFNTYSKPIFMGKHQTFSWRTDTEQNIQDVFAKAVSAIEGLVRAKFDAQWYWDHYSDNLQLPDRDNSEALFMHYQENVSVQHMSPNGEFDELDYLEKFPDVKIEVEQGVHLSGYDHFLKIGRRRNGNF